MQNLTRASTRPPAWHQHELATGKGGCREGRGRRRRKNGVHTRPHAQTTWRARLCDGACCHCRYYCDCRRHCFSPHISWYQAANRTQPRCDQTPFLTSDQFRCLWHFLSFLLRNRNSAAFTTLCTHLNILIKFSPLLLLLLLSSTSRNLFFHHYYDTNQTRLQQKNK